MRSHSPSLVRGPLYFLSTVAMALSVGIAADYGIAPAHAAVAQISASGAGVHASSDELDLRTGNLLAAAGKAIGPDPGSEFVRVPGHVVGALSKAVVVDDTAESEPLTLTLVLKRDDQAGFDHYMEEVYNPHARNYRHFLTPTQLARKFGPSKQSYAEVLDYLRDSGFQLIQGSKNHLTLTVRGSREVTDRAFKLVIRDYKIGDAIFHASDWDPALPAKLLPHVLAINGLSALAPAQPAIAKIYCAPIGPDGIPTVNLGAAGSPGEQACRVRVLAVFGLVNILGCLLATVVTAFLPALAVPGAVVAGALTTGEICALRDILINANNLYSGGAGASAIRGPASPSGGPKGAASVANLPRAVSDGTGQKIGLLEFDGFYRSDVAGYLNLIGAPSTQINNLSVVAVNGGVTSPGSGEGEVLLDIDTVMNLAPGAKVVVYESPFGGQAASYSAIFNTMINDGVTVISNSWASCEDQVPQAEAQSIDAVLQSAAASGISVFNGSGDSGSTCLDGSANTISVPADSPSATAVGGTSLPSGFGPGETYGNETWWNGTNDLPPTGQGGFGVSKYFSRPAYQAAVNSASMRSIPDVVVRADPANGPTICQADDGGCPNGSLIGGTSLAAPEWAAFAALLNQSLGKNLGSFNPLLYPLAATDAFHSASSMGSDFAHVGLGSPNLNVLARSLKGQSVGLPSVSASQLTALAQPASALVTNGAIAVPADGTSPGGVKVTLYDANGNTVSGKTVTLHANNTDAVITPASGVSTVSSGAVVFTVTDLTAETLTFTATDTTDGIVLTPVTLTFGVPSAASAGITANPPSLPADGQTPATITVTLKDSLNRPSPGKSITIADAGAHAVITGPTSGVTDANGQIQFSATDQVNETVTFTAVDVTDANLPVPGSAAVTYSGSVSTACGVGVAPVAGNGYTITAFVTGLPAAATLYYNNVNEACPGGDNPAFTAAGTVLAPDFLTGGIFQTGLSGGAVSSTNLISTLTPTLGNPTFGKDGSLYATEGTTGAEIVQLNPATGAVLRVVASGLTCPTGLSVDPLSGDLFFDDDCTGAGTNNASIFRVIDPANTDPGNPTSVVVYATLPNSPNGAMAFAPNGTLYAVSGYFGNVNAPVEQISATNSPTVTVTPVTGITSDFAVAIGIANADGSAQSLIVEPAGNLSEVPIAAPSAAVVLATGSPGVGVTGPDGCLYSAHYDTIYRLAPSDGVCTFAPTSPAAAMKLTPAAVSPNPAQGGSQTFTATLRNASPLSGVPVTFVVNGVNAQMKIVNTDANGNAALTYTAYSAGSDSVTAAATVKSSAVNSNVAKVTWAAGKHVTFLTLNGSAQSGTLKQAVNVAASLSDTSAYPVAAISGQTVSFTLGGSTCTASTNSAGIATCPLTPSQAGSGSLDASFAGNSQFVGATTIAEFNVFGVPTPAPTVTIAVSPTSVAAGAGATLTWSSTNATACTASGSWSGAQAASGTQSVTAAAIGSYTYTLTCSGPGGMSAASAALSATLVAVTVTAKSGGGALSGSLCLLLGLLVLVRLNRRAGLAAVCCLAVFAGVGPVRADQAAATGADGNTPFDNLYVGVRVGSMHVNLDSGKLDQGLASLGYSNVQASTDTSATAGTVYIGYQWNPWAGLEFGFSHRQSNVASLSGTVPSSANIVPLLQDTAELIRGYGNIFSLSWRGHIELAPRLLIEPRIGGFFYDTKVTADGGGASVDATHQGGGVTAGLGAAYRVWRGLELGIGVDYFRGSPNTVATLYSGSLEWRFGQSP
jgi:hypothetical protein